MIQTKHIEVLSGTTNPKYQDFTTATLKFGLAKYFITHHAHMQPFHGPEAFCPGTTRQDNQIQEQATMIYDACPRPRSQSTTINHTEIKPLPGHSCSWKGPHITAEYYPGTWNRTPGARASLHIPKPKFQTNIKERINCCHN